ncbi:ATP-binding cassette domain-containing protein [Paludibacterium paludis]|uniref:ABC transporter ATP-binding protein n=1 Tax=Paludibacterium paludis TaxID=1225769 RepID=A0A918P413_9NEIS|nr:ATP-binding cassette domain-containing protein [Paludibacterium paludis]GGY19829.1 ABC transporter ATP-binding protein [Paludibacterium paludis]
MNGHAIVADGLHHTFAGVPALHRVDAAIRRGTITALAGPDGAGKTTLMRLIAGLLAPSGGLLRVNGLDPVADAGALRQRLGYMPQKFGLYEDLTVLENLDLYADLRDVTGDARASRLARLLSFTDLARFTSRPAGKLSGGMKQKLGLACTLIGSPDVLLLDEPCVGVDPVSRRELWRMVCQLASDGMTIVWGTSYLDEAERCSDLLLMHEGRVIHSGTPGELIASMTGRSMLLRNIEGNRRAVLRRVVCSERVIDGVLQGEAIRLVLAEPGRAPDSAGLGAGADAQLVDARPRLEDAFMALVGGGPMGVSPLADHLDRVEWPSGVDDTGAIEATDLTRRFGDFIAADRVGFRVRRGEIFGLLGPNGAGKSTTFKMMCGLLRPTSGEARVMGYDLTRSPGKARQQLGYMAQKFALYGNLSVAQNLRFFSGIYGLRGKIRDERIADMVRIFALGPYLDMSAGELPLGFKQRLALSCALMHRPAILFLDEPTSGVDPVTRREFWSHINGLVDKGVTVMVTTHFMDEAEYCDRIGLVYRGRMIAAGTPDELKRRARSDTLPDPTMEDAFIALIEREERTGESA